jgi:hypothetical protein
MKPIEKILAAFSLGQMQDFMTMHKVMREHDISVESLESYINDKMANIAEIHRIRQNMPDCPACGGKLGLQAITTPQGRANVNGYRSVWYCQADDCNYEEYSMDDVRAALIKRRATI